MITAVAGEEKQYHDDLVSSVGRTRLRAPAHAEFGQIKSKWFLAWSEICVQAKAHIDAGTNPADPLVQETAQRWLALMEDMIGGDRAILSGMYAKMDGRGPEAATMGVVSAEVWDYMKRALSV